MRVLLALSGLLVLLSLVLLLLGVRNVADGLLWAAVGASGVAAVLVVVALLSRRPRDLN